MGEPVSLGDHPLGTNFSGGRRLSVSANGTLAYTTNVLSPRTSCGRTWTASRSADIPMAPGKYIDVELSPDGRHAVLESSPRIGMSDLWLADLERGVVTRLSYDTGREHRRVLVSRWNARRVHSSRYGGARRSWS